MKWEAKYTVERKDGRKEEKTEQIEARSIREASMAAHATIVRPLQRMKTIKSVAISSLKAIEPA